MQCNVTILNWEFQSGVQMFWKKKQQQQQQQLKHFLLNKTEDLWIV